MSLLSPGILIEYVPFRQSFAGQLRQLEYGA